MRVSHVEISVDPKIRESSLTFHWMTATAKFKYKLKSRNQRKYCKQKLSITNYSTRLHMHPVSWKRKWSEYEVFIKTTFFIGQQGINCIFDWQQKAPFYSGRTDTFRCSWFCIHLPNMQSPKYKSSKRVMWCNKLAGNKHAKIDIMHVV